MSIPDQKVAVITGASQGISAGSGEATYRKLDDAAVASPRSIATSADRRNAAHHPCSVTARCGTSCAPG